MARILCLLHEGDRGAIEQPRWFAHDCVLLFSRPLELPEMLDRLGALVLVGLSCASPGLALAEPPRVHFDMPYAVACRDVTPAEYVLSHPEQKLMEAKLAISALLAAGEEKDLTQFFIRVDSPQRTLSIADYLPKTKHEATATAMTKQTSTENVMALGVNLSGKYELLSLPGPSAGVGEKKTSSVKIDLLPPLETVAASGTLDRATALFFKIKATPRNLLEGTRDYALVLSVPTVWRADYIRVRCEAEGIRRGMVSTFDEEVTCGKREFVVALYQDGDEGARNIAENFARREAAKAVQPKSKSQGQTSASAMRRPNEFSPWTAVQR